MEYIPTAIKISGKRSKVGLSCFLLFFFQQNPVLFFPVLTSLRAPMPPADAWQAQRSIRVQQQPCWS
jgi:hypothetical protein